MTHDLTAAIEAVLYAENHANLCGCKHWPDGCLNGIVPAFTLAVEDVLRVAAPLIVAAERERIATALTAVDPIEWALAGQDCGRIAADIARTVHPVAASQDEEQQP
jgi:hypothetical protein